MKLRSQGGFTLLELMSAALIAGLLLAVALPTYRARVERLKVSTAAQDLVRLATAIERYRNAHNFRFPDTLDEVTGTPPTDPWGNPYQYLSFDSSAPGVKGKIRKDHNLHPLNSDFDLYSMGADGKSSAPLTAKASHDDVIWARDGSFVGLGKDF